MVRQGSSVRPAASGRLRSARVWIVTLGLTACTALRAQPEDLRFEPPVPTPADVVVAILTQTDTCRIWDGVSRGASTIQISGRLVAPPCPDWLAAQSVVLGRLDPGTYSVAAFHAVANAPSVSRTLTVGLPVDTSHLHVESDPRLPAADRSLRIRIREDLVTCVPGVDAPVASPGRLAFTSQPVFAIDPCPFVNGWDQTFEVGPLAAGDYQITLDDVALGNLHVAAPSTQLALRAARFVLTVDRADGASTFAAPAVALSDESGYFWFFDPGNVEVSVKLLDGRAINGHFWLFASRLTDRAMSLTILDNRGSCLGLPDPSACPRRTYTSAVGSTGSIVDLEAFAD